MFFFSDLTFDWKLHNLYVKEQGLNIMYVRCLEGFCTQPHTILPELKPQTRTKYLKFFFVLISTLHIFIIPEYIRKSLLLSFDINSFE